MFNDGYDAYCHQVINLSPPGIPDDGILSGCSQFLRSLVSKKSSNQAIKSD